MKKQLFNELVESIKEAGQIHRDEIRASREFVFDAQELLHSSESDKPTD